MKLRRWYWSSFSLSWLDLRESDVLLSTSVANSWKKLANFCDFDHPFLKRKLCFNWAMCKRGFGSPRIWIPHPKTLADLDDPKRGFGSPADLDPSIYFVCDRLENDDVEFWEPNPRTPKRGFGSPADLDPDSQRIVEDLFRHVHRWLTVTDRLFWWSNYVIVLQQAWTEARDAFRAASPRCN